MSPYNKPEFVSIRLKATFLIVISLLLLSACNELCQPVQPYLVLYAFGAEGELMAQNMEAAKCDTLLGHKVYMGRLSGKNVVLAESGVGMTNAAMTAQMMIDKYHPKGVIFSGIAGAIDTLVHIGDIAIAEKWVTHEYGYYGKNGFVPSELEVYFPRVDSIAAVTYLDVDSGLFSKAGRLITERISLDSVGNRVPKVIVGGIGASGNSFIDQVEKRLWLSEKFRALTVDMESAAVAQVCTANNVPFIIFRSASDLAGGSGSESARVEIDEFFEVAAGNSAKVVMRFIESL